MGRRSINLGVEVKTTSPKEKILTKAFNQFAILYEMAIFYVSAESERYFKVFCVVSCLGVFVKNCCKLSIVRLY